MGRAPTSGYCHNCRRRRVKCDKTKPACNNCTRLKRECEGYAIPLRIKSYVGGGPPEASSSRSTDKLQPARLRAHKTTRSYNASYVDQPAPPPELDLHGFRELMALTHFFETYHWAYFWRPEQYRPQVDNNMYSINLALVYGHMANQCDVPDLKVESLRLFHSAISRVRRTLASGSPQEIVRALPVLITLNQYEFTVNGKLAAVHAAGMQQILQNFGPNFFKQEPELSSFRIARGASCCLSLGSARRSFLADDEWMTIPFANEPKTLYDKLIDVLIGLTELVERVNDHLCSSEGSSEEEVLLLMRTIETLLVTLADWRTRWAGCNPNAAWVVPFEIPPASYHEDHQHDPMRGLLSTALDFSSADLAFEILTYDAAVMKLVLLHCALSGLEPDLSTCFSMVGGADCSSGSGGGNPFSPPSSNSPRLMMTSPLPDEWTDAAAATGEGYQNALLLPEQVRFLWQPAVEALRTLPYILKSEPSVRAGCPTMFVVNPVELLYSFLKNLGMHEVIAEVIGGRFDFRRADEEVEVEIKASFAY